MLSSPHWRLPSGQSISPPKRRPPRVILSFDVEEHFRIEAAASLAIGEGQRNHYSSRLECSTKWLLDQLDRFHLKATFFVVGQIARTHPRMISQMADAGHEVASHSWDHRRIHEHTPSSFREDLYKSRDALEQLIGQPVLGYRAPTFSMVAETAWALDVLAETGFTYDSSIFPVKHDRYGIPQAPRTPFRARGNEHEILEIPPATLRVLGMNLPVGGGGYFRFFPTFLLDKALSQIKRDDDFPVAMLYFHPWEFDPGQTKLPLGVFNAFRTYVGISRSRPRLLSFLAAHAFCRAIDAAKELDRHWNELPSFAPRAPEVQRITSDLQAHESMGHEPRTAVSQRLQGLIG